MIKGANSNRHLFYFIKTINFLACSFHRIG